MAMIAPEAARSERYASDISSVTAMLDFAIDYATGGMAISPLPGPGGGWNVM
ncbi:hypothetical protein [Cupriavidus necator]|uniref:hypothetical protein n=1 Tax=Cupriavidus necator TaxID=106590 RepID=UPI000ABD3559|nr:hypothetical protein [Cupriavidus necator]